MAQVPVGFELVGLGRLDQAVETGTGPGAFGVAGEQPVLPTDHKRADGIFRQVIVRPEAAIVKVMTQSRPLPQGIGNRLAEQALGGTSPDSPLSHACIDSSTGADFSWRSLAAS